jgi:ABC-type phosphate/phosphonate transport system substrate-binding protein
MSGFVAALPMYDWPEARAETDAEWSLLSGVLKARRIDPPASLVRRNADLPAVPGGIRDGDGRTIAPDPSTLPADQLDLHTLWRHPALILAQTCWGPMEFGLAEHVRVVGQPDYSAFEGGEGAFYSSAILMRRDDAGRVGDMAAPADGSALVPVDRMANARLAYNSVDSMSGLIALTRDLERRHSLMGLFSGMVETGGHRASIAAVAEGRADLCAVDCRSWAMAKRYEGRLCGRLAVIGWTRRRKGLPFISSLNCPAYCLD